MAKWWREERTNLREVMTGPSFDSQRTSSLDPGYLYHVRIYSFTFRFISLEDIQRCLDYYRVKIHPSTSLPNDVLHGDNSECQRWFEELPRYLCDEPKRVKVVAALSKALEEFVTMAQHDFPDTEDPAAGASPVLEMVPAERITEMIYWRECLSSDENNNSRFSV